MKVCAIFLESNLVTHIKSAHILKPSNSTSENHYKDITKLEKNALRRKAVNTKKLKSNGLIISRITVQILTKLYYNKKMTLDWGKKRI